MKNGKVYYDDVNIRKWIDRDKTAKRTKNKDEREKKEEEIEKKKKKKEK